MRDLTGYGGQWPDLTWPGGKKLAVSVNVNFEEGAEWQVGDGDPLSERLGEVISVVERVCAIRDRNRSLPMAHALASGACWTGWNAIPWPRPFSSVAALWNALPLSPPR